MSDAETIEDPEVNELRQQKKLVCRDLGDPGTVKALNIDATGKPIEGSFRYPGVCVLGTIIGRVTKLVELKSADGELFMAFGGTFEGVSDVTGDVIQAGVLTLPSGFHDQMMEDYYEAKKTAGDGREIAIEFALEVGTVRKNNPQGYSWQFRPLLKATKADPLAGIRLAMRERKRAAITDASGKAGTAGNAGKVKAPPATITPDGKAA